MSADARRSAVAGINHVTLASAAPAAAAAFYVEVLGCDLVARWPAGAYLLAGSTWLAIVEGPAETRARSDYSHIAFDVSPFEFDAMAAALLARGVETWQDNWTQGDSLYFRDPDGHQLEIHATTLAERVASASAEPWPGLELTATAATLARRPPTVADPLKPRRFACSPIGVFVVVVRDDGRILLLRAPDGRVEVPNGAVEFGEQPVDAAQRELREEAGPVETGEFACFAAFHVDYDNRLPPLLSVGFAARHRGGEPRAGDDMAHCEPVWSSTEEIDPRALGVPREVALLEQAISAVRHHGSA
jgi:catechol 2,3-dioxygenase-like lactoylglutathione lyase family enzyme/8-oxo-dGTP pyrophosphatase MutT (NUDIX family)